MQFDTVQTFNAFVFNFESHKKMGKKEKKIAIGKNN
jgi:hypothetical protein